MKNAKGFTLVELIIVIIIVGILSIVAVPVYRGYTKKAMGTEAKALLGAVATAQKVYYAEYDHFYGVDSSGEGEAGSIDTSKLVSYNSLLDVDVRGNKYFTGYAVAMEGDGATAKFTAITSGNQTTGADKLSMTLITNSTGAPSLTENYGTDY